MNRDYSFLRQCWREKARREKGEKTKISIWDLEEMIKAVGDKEKLQTLQHCINELKENCREYLELVQKRSKVEGKFREEAIDQAMVESVDFGQRAKHQVIVDGLNILSRLFAQAGLDNSWRGYFRDWDQIGEWAMETGKELTAWRKEN